MLLSFLLVHELRRRHLLFRALEEESVERVNQGLEREKLNNRRIDNLSADLVQIKSDKDRIEAELASKREDADFLEAEALELEEKVADLGRRYEDVSAKKLEVEEENEQLSEQVETIRQLISTKFNNMKVENIVEFLSGKSASGTSLDAFAAVDSESKEFRKLLKIISSYVDLKGGAKVNFPDHGTNHIVKEFYNKFDNEFLTKFFCHISSDAYSESNVNRIKVLVNDGDEEGYDGKVNIYIKNGKYGCCLSLRFNKGKKVNTANLGYALALIVKSKFKFLDSYEIKAAL
jgi:archaellum component FlaC